MAVSTNTHALIEIVARPKTRCHKKKISGGTISRAMLRGHFSFCVVDELFFCEASLHDLQEVHRQLLMNHNGQAPPLPAVVSEMLKLPHS